MEKKKSDGTKEKLNGETEKKVKDKNENGIDRRLVIAGCITLAVILVIVILAAVFGKKKKKETPVDTITGEEDFYPVSLSRQEDGSYYITIDGKKDPECRWLQGECTAYVSDSEIGSEENETIGIKVTPRSVGTDTLRFSRVSEEDERLVYANVVIPLYLYDDEGGNLVLRTGTVSIQSFDLQKVGEGSSAPAIITNEDGRIDIFFDTRLTDIHMEISETDIVSLSALEYSLDENGDSAGCGLSVWPVADGDVVLTFSSDGINLQEMEENIKSIEEMSYEYATDNEADKAEYEILIKSAKDDYLPLLKEKYEECKELIGKFGEEPYASFSLELKLHSENGEISVEQ